MKNNKTKKGLFITFEGGEGSGKSLQTRALYRQLQKQGLPSLLIHEPGSTVLGEKLCRLLKRGNIADISPLSELLLFNAARAQLVAEVILPALQDGKIVVCDRFYDSTTVYQGYARGLDQHLVHSANRIATGGLVPDITFLLDIPVRQGLARKSIRETNRFERAAIEFHEKVRQGYLLLAKNEPERFIVIDSSQSPEHINRIIWQTLSAKWD